MARYLTRSQTGTGRPRSSSRADPLGQSSRLAAVVTDGIGWAAVQGFASLTPFLRRHGLMEDHSHAEFVIAAEGRGSRFPAEVTVDAGRATPSVVERSSPPRGWSSFAMSPVQPV